MAVFTVARTPTLGCFAQAVCLVLVVVNLTLEPASFITSNALTTLCGDAFFAKNFAQAASPPRRRPRAA